MIFNTVYLLYKLGIILIDIGKSLKASSIPLLVFIVLGFVSSLITIFVPTLYCVGWIVIPVNAVLVAWAGFRAAKEQGLDLVGGALAGMIVGTVGAIVTNVVGVVISIIASFLNGANGLLTIGFIIGGALLWTAGWIVIGLIGGPILGAIGAYIAGMKK